jgi:hypothetical protein
VTIVPITRHFVILLRIVKKKKKKTNRHAYDNNMRIIKVTVRFQDACQRLNDKTETL